MDKELEGEELPGGELSLLGRSRGRQKPVPDAPVVPEPFEVPYTPVEQLVDAEVLAMIEEERRRHGPGWEGEWD